MCTATAVLELCDGHRTIRTIADEIAARFTPPPTIDVAAEIRVFLERLERLGLIVER